MNMISFLGIVAGMVLLVILVYKGMSNIYVAPICAVLVMITNNLPILDTFIGTYLGGISNWMPVGFAFAILGALFGKIYEKTGAAESVGHFLLDKLSSDRNTSQSYMVLLGLIVINVVGALLTWTGVSGIVVILSMVPIGFSIAREANIPRKFVPALVMNSGVSAAMAAPGSPSIGNLTASKILGTTANAAPIPGLICIILVIILGIFYMHRVIMSSIRKGEGFTEKEDYVEANEKNRVFPNFFLALIPLFAVFITFVIFNLNITICLTAGIILAIILLSRYLPNRSAKSVFNMLNEGISNGCVVFFQVASLMGFAAVVQQTKGFQLIMETVTGIDGPPLIVATIAILIFVLLTTSPPASLQLGLPAFLPAIESGAFAATALHRTAVIATTTFESMPYCGGAIIAMSTAGVSFKDGYKYVCMCTVVIPLICTIVCSLLLLLVPSLA